MNKKIDYSKIMGYNHYIHMCAYIYTFMQMSRFVFMLSGTCLVNCEYEMSWSLFSARNFSCNTSKEDTSASFYLAFHLAQQQSYLKNQALCCVNLLFSFVVRYSFYLIAGLSVLQIGDRSTWVYALHIPCQWVKCYLEARLWHELHYLHSFHLHLTQQGWP